VQISNPVRDFMVRTKCSSAWLSENTGISARHLLRLKMRPEKFPLGANTAKKFLEFMERHDGQPTPTAAELIERARQNHGELCKEMWADPEFRAKQMRTRGTRRASIKASESARKAWATRKADPEYRMKQMRIRRKRKAKKEASEAAKARRQ